MSFDKKILDDISWSFGFGSFGNQTVFTQELKEYNDAVNRSGINYNQIILKSKSIIVLYEAYNIGTNDFDDKQVRIEANNGTSFSIAELMFKLNEAVSPSIKELDKRFFEGLTFETADNPAADFGIPIYLLNVGS